MTAQTTQREPPRTNSDHGGRIECWSYDSRGSQDEMAGQWDRGQSGIHKIFTLRVDFFSLQQQDNFRNPIAASAPKPLPDSLQAHKGAYYGRLDKTNQTRLDQTRKPSPEKRHENERIPEPPGTWTQGCRHEAHTSTPTSSRFQHAP